MDNIQGRPSELIQFRHKELVKILKNHSSTLLDELKSRGIITESEYEALYAKDDPERRVQDVLYIVKKKGEFACQQFLKCAAEIHSEDPHDPCWNERITPPGHGFHYQSAHDSCFVDKKIRVTCGGMCIWVPNPAEENEPDCGEQLPGAGLVGFDRTDFEATSRDPESASQTSENESANETLQEPEPDHFSRVV